MFPYKWGVLLRPVRKQKLFSLKQTEMPKYGIKRGSLKVSLLIGKELFEQFF
jgi:hypothetical protein